MEQSLSQRFLEQFVLDLILQRSPKQEAVQTQEFPIENETVEEQVVPAPIKSPSQFTPIFPSRRITREVSPRINPVYPTVQQPKQQSPPTQQISISSNSFAKIEKFLQDPRVQGVECTGPNKNILVNSDGAIKSTSSILTKEEINSIMQEISQKTRIPLINGVFKAAFNNYILTAVLSEFIGTRFVIQKRNPFQPLKNY